MKFGISTAESDVYSESCITLAEKHIKSMFMENSKQCCLELKPAFLNVKMCASSV